MGTHTDTHMCSHKKNGETSNTQNLQMQGLLGGFFFTTRFAECLTEQVLILRL